MTYLIKRGFDKKAAADREREHTSIVKALESRNAATLKAALRAHTQTSERAILATFKNEEPATEKSRRR